MTLPELVLVLVKKLIEDEKQLVENTKVKNKENYD